MLPARDVKFLQSVVHRLSERRLHVYAPGVHRSAVALILRFGGAEQKTLSRVMSPFLTEKARRERGEDCYEGDRNRPYGDGLLSRFMDRNPAGAGPVFSRSNDSSTSGEGLEEKSTSKQAREATAVTRAIDELTQFVDPDMPSSLRMLFMKRKDVSADRWSGQVSFPGGHRDPDDADDLATVYREVYEVLGLPLSSREFLCLGRLPDYHTHSRVVHQQGTVVARFVFLHLGDVTPSVQIADHEVESVRWMPLDRLRPSFVVPDSVVHPLTCFMQTKEADRKLIVSEVFPGALVAFPSVSMPIFGEGGEEGIASSPVSSSCGDAADPSAHQKRSGSSSSEQSGGRAKASASNPCAATAEVHRLPPWRVWGLTLRCASELVMLDDRPVLDWPLFSSNSTLLQHVAIDAFHGYFELLFQFYRLRAWIRYDALGVGREGRAQGDVKDTEGAAFCAASSSVTRAQQAYRDYTFGGPHQRRRAILPISAPLLLAAVPEKPSGTRVGFFMLDAALVLLVVYSVAAVVHFGFTALRVALGLETVAAATTVSRRPAYRAVPQPCASAGAKFKAMAAPEQQEHTRMPAMNEVYGAANPEEGKMLTVPEKDKLTYATDVDVEEHRQRAWWGRVMGASRSDTPHARAEGSHATAAAEVPLAPFVMADTLRAEGERPTVIVAVTTYASHVSPSSANARGASETRDTGDDGGEMTPSAVASEERLPEHRSQGHLEDIMRRYRR